MAGLARLPREAPEHLRVCAGPVPREHTEDGGHRGGDTLLCPSASDDQAAWATSQRSASARRALEDCIRSTAFLTPGFMFISHSKNGVPCAE